MLGVRYDGFDFFMYFAKKIILWRYFLILILYIHLTTYLALFHQIVFRVLFLLKEKKINYWLEKAIFNDF